MGLRTFTFGGTSSSTYSMFITEAATYNVPERAVEMVSIPGRNGAFAHDLGRFENVEVKYHVVVHKDTNANFQTELSSVRNWLASKVGYQRLTDDYNSNVYRMAVYKSGLETSETFVNGAEFDIVFDCKPQRWLTSGETATAVASGGTITNPTLFDAKPQLQVKGYGTIEIGGAEIDVLYIPTGIIQISNPVNVGLSYETSRSFTQTINGDALANGDIIDVSSEQISARIIIPNNKRPITDVTTTTWTFDSSPNITYTTGEIIISAKPHNGVKFIKGTADSITLRAQFNYTGNGVSYIAEVFWIRWDYDGANTITQTCGLYNNYSDLVIYVDVYVPELYCYSSKVGTGNPLYIDLDIGEAWNEDNTTPTPLNNVVQLPANLPVLPSGATKVCGA